MLFQAFNRSPCLESDVLCTYPVGRVSRQLGHGCLGIAPSFGESMHHHLLLGTCQLGAGLVAVGGIDHAQLVPGVRIFAITRHRCLEHPLRFGQICRVFGGNQRMPESCRDQRLKAAEIRGLAQWNEGFGRLAGLKQDLAFELQELGVVGCLGKKRVSFGHGLVEKG